MLVSLPLIALISLALLFREKGECWRNAVLSAALVWGALIAAIPEALSLGGLVAVPWLTAVWALLDIVIVLTYLRAKMRRRSVAHSKAVVSLPAFEIVTLVSVALIVMLIGVIALVAPPNNWDSMTYHMARVVHWIQNRSVDYYPTSILRQLYQKPWAEYAIMQFQLLSGGDRFANIVQWLSMVGSIVGVSLIARKLGATARGQILAAVVCATIPMGILQGSSTQNDYAVSFWLVCFAYYVLVAVQKEKRDSSFVPVDSAREAPSTPGTLCHAATDSDGSHADRSFTFRGESPPDWSLPLRHRIGRSGSRSGSSRSPLLASLKIGASLGLAFLTKGSAYIYAVPFFAWFLISGVRRLGWNLWRPVFWIAIITIALNVSHEVRNLRVFEHPITQGNDEIANRSFGLRPLISNLVRNIALHVVTWPSEGVVRRVHTYLGIDLNDPSTTFAEFSVPHIGTPHQVLHEDYAGNTLHLVLIFGTTTLFLIRRDLPNNRIALPYLGSLVAAFLLFCVFMKWAPYHSRIHLPLFVMSSAPVGLALSMLSRHKAHAIVIVLVLSSLPWLLFNQSRPLILRFVPTYPGLAVKFQNVFNMDRNVLDFINRDELRESYVGAASFVGSLECFRVGLSIGTDAWEYPFWTLLQAGPESRYQLEHVNVGNISTRKNSVERYRRFVPCAVIHVENAHGRKPMPPLLTVQDRRYGKDWSLDRVHVYVQR